VLNPVRSRGRDQGMSRILKFPLAAAAIALAVAAFSSGTSTN
jgi:hypothetical protein